MGLHPVGHRPALREWTGVFGSERLAGALLDRLTHHVHILGMNGESCRLKRSRETGPPIRQKNRTTHNAPSMLPLPNSCKVATPANLLLTVIRPVVHGCSATVACFVDALDKHLYHRPNRVTASREKAAQPPEGRFPPFPPSRALGPEKGRKRRPRPYSSKTGPRFRTTSRKNAHTAARRPFRAVFDPPA